MSPKQIAEEATKDYNDNIKSILLKHSRFVNTGGSIIKTYKVKTKRNNELVVKCTIKYGEPVYYSYMYYNTSHGRYLVFMDNYKVGWDNSFVEIYSPHCISRFKERLDPNITWDSLASKLTNECSCNSLCCKTDESTKELTIYSRNGMFRVLELGNIWIYKTFINKNTFTPFQKKCHKQAYEQYENA